jgi:putative Holliday junction resolvase
LRALGIDFGDRRIGLALSDVTGTLASPLTTLSYRAGKRPPLAEVERMARELGVEQLVMGLPLDLSGAETERCVAARRVGEALADRLGVAVHYVDERMTSVRAQRLVRSSGLPRWRRKQKARVDAAAAALILQSFLDRSRAP